MQINSTLKVHIHTTKRPKLHKTCVIRSVVDFYSQMLAFVTQHTNKIISKILIYLDIKLLPGHLVIQITEK